MQNSAGIPAQVLEDVMAKGDSRSAAAQKKEQLTKILEAEQEPKKAKRPKKAATRAPESVRLATAAFDAGNYEQAVEQYSKVEVGDNAYPEAQRRLKEAQVHLCMLRWSDFLGKDQEDDAYTAALEALDLGRRLKEAGGEGASIEYLIEQATDFGKSLLLRASYARARKIFIGLQGLEPENENIAHQVEISSTIIELDFRSRVRMEGLDIEAGATPEQFDEVIEDCRRILAENPRDEDVIIRSQKAMQAKRELVSSRTRRLMGLGNDALKIHDYTWAVEYFGKVRTLNKGWNKAQETDAGLRLREAEQKAESTSEVQQAIGEGLEAVKRLDQESAIDHLADAKFIARKGGLEHLVDEIQEYVARAEFITERLGEAELATSDDDYGLAKQSLEAVWKREPQCRSSLEPLLEKARAGLVQKTQRDADDGKLVQQAQHLRDLAGIETGYKETVKRLSGLRSKVSATRGGEVEDLVREVEKKRAERLAELEKVTIAFRKGGDCDTALSSVSSILESSPAFSAARDFFEEMEAERHKQRQQGAGAETRRLLNEAASALEDESDPDKATKLARVVLDGSPRSTQARGILSRAMKFRGQQSFAAGDYRAAEEELRKVVELDKRDKNARDLLARIEQSQAKVGEAKTALRQGDFAGAMALLKDAGPNNLARTLLKKVHRTESQFEDGRQALRSGDLETAISLLEKARRSSPDCQEIIDELGRTRFSKFLQAGQEDLDQGRYGEAMRSLRRALRYEPSDEKVRRLLESARNLKKGRDARLEDLLREAESLLEAGDSRMAVEKALEAVGLHPNGKRAKGTLSRARRKWNAELREEFNARMHDGERLEAQGSFEEALARYEDILTEFEPLDRASERGVADAIERVMSINILLGKAREAMQDPYGLHEAETLLEKALELAPDGKNEALSRLLQDVGLRKSDMDRIREFVEAAEAARDEGDLAGAGQHYSSARNLAGTMDGADGLMQSIRDSLAELTAEETRIAEAAEFYRKGKHAMESGRFADAVGYLESACERDPGHAEAGVLLQEARRAKQTEEKTAKLLREARELLEQRTSGAASLAGDKVAEALILDPDNAEATRLGQAIQDWLARDRSITQYVQAAHKGLSQYDWEKALQCVEEAERLEPGRLDVAELRTKADKEKRRIQAAVMHYRLGRELEQRGKYGKAAEHYREVLKLDADGNMVEALGLALEVTHAPEKSEKGNGAS